MKKTVTLAAMAGLAVSAGSAFAQCGTFATGSTPNAFEAGINDVGNHCDDCTTAGIALPFPVSLYGTAYSSMNVSSNGNLQFGSNSASLGNTCVLPTATFTGGPTIMYYWDDLRTDQAGGGIFTSLSGAPGSQRFNIEYRGVRFGTTDAVNMSVSFYEGQSFFDVFYVNPSTNLGASATAAVQANGVTGSSNTVYSCNTGTIAAGSSMRYLCPLSLPPSCVLADAPATGPVGTVITVTSTTTQGIPASPITSVSLDATLVDAGTVAMLDNGVFPDALAGDGIFTANVTVGAASGFGNQTLTSNLTDGLGRTSACSTSFNVIPPPPVNDECGGALAAVDGSNAYDTTSSTTSAGNGSPCGAIGTDVWFAYEASCNGTCNITTCGATGIDTVIAVYAGCGDATALACNDDSCGLQSSVDFTATAGTTYYIRMGDFGGGNPHAGTFTITPGGSANPLVSNVQVDTTCADIGGTVTITADVLAASCPSADPIASVSADASALNGGTVAMNDSGVAPDAAAGDGTWSGSATVGAGASGGAIAVTATSVGSLTGGANSAAVNINSADDAGDVLATALVMSGDGSALTSISGFIGANCVAGNDVDMFQITICDPATFSASTCGSGVTDTQLFLFDAAGMGIAVNDDSCGLQSNLTSTFTASLSAGTYYLAISPYNIDPLDEGGALIWLNTPFASERAPDGAGAANPVASWTGTGGGGSYIIALTGTCSVNSNPPCDPDLNQDGNVDQDDIAYLINVVGGGENPTNIDPDFNRDGNVDQDDISALINTVGGGGCP